MYAPEEAEAEEGRVNVSHAAAALTDLGEWSDRQPQPTTLISSMIDLTHMSHDPRRQVWWSGNARNSRAVDGRRISFEWSTEVKEQQHC